MTKIIEQIRRKKLAKKIAGVTLGAVALGMASMLPVHAEGMVRGGDYNLTENTYIGNSASDYKVTIFGPPAQTLDWDYLLADMKIYGRKDTTSVGTITGSITASGFKNDLLMSISGLELWGGNSTVAGVKGVNNKVTWSSSAEVDNIKNITGFEAFANGVSAEGTVVDIAGATVTNGIRGAYLSGLQGGLTAKDTTVTLTDVTASNVIVFGVAGNTAAGSAEAENTEVNITRGSFKGIIGVSLLGEKSATAIGTKINIKGATIDGYEIRGARVWTGSNSSLTAAQDTNVTLTDTTVKNANVYGVGLRGNSMTADVTTVKLTNVQGSVAIGAEVALFDKATVDNTTVDISGGKLTTATGVYVSNTNKPSELNTNITKVLLSNKAEIESDVYGVQIDDQVTNAKINDTKIELKDSVTIGGNVYGVDVNEKVIGANVTDTKIDLGNSDIEGHVSGVNFNQIDEHKTEEATVTGTVITSNGAKVGGTLFGVDAQVLNKATITGTDITLNGGEITGSVTGVKATTEAEGSEASATGTTVKLTDTEVSSTVTGAYVKGKISATANTTTVDITDGTPYEVYGANVFADAEGSEASATGTKVTLTGTDVDNEFYGALVNGKKNATATGTEVTINGGKVEHAHVYGANVQANESGDSTAEANDTKLVTDGTILNNEVTGAYVKGSGKSAKASGTVVSITDGELHNELKGAEVQVGSDGVAEASGTELTINGTEFSSDYANVIGAAVQAEGGADSVAKATDTTVTLNNVTNGQDILGARVINAATATATGTTVDITDSTINELVGVKFDAGQGANVTDATATGTKVTLTDTEASSDVDGVYIIAENSAKADTTEVNISGESVSGNITGAYLEAIVTDNGVAVANKTTLTIEDAEVEGGVTGAWVYGTKSAKADGTEVEITGENSVIGSLTGAYVDADGDDGEAEANNTKLTIDGATFEEKVIGVDVYGTKRAKADTTTVEITDGTFEYSFTGANVTTSFDANGDAEAKDTELTIIDTDFNDAFTGAYVRGDKSATADTTTVEITGGALKNNLTGAEVATTGTDGVATAKNTTVELTNTKTDDGVYPVNVIGAEVIGLKSAKADTTTVDITGESVTGALTGAAVNAEAGEAEAKDTTLTITDTTLEDVVTGAEVIGLKSAKADTTIVDITRGTLKGGVWTDYALVGADVRADVSADGEAEAIGTTVTLTDTKADGDVTGAYVEGQKKATVTDTEVDITGGTIEGALIAADVNTDGEAEAIGSTVMLTDTTVNADVYGVAVDGSSPYVAPKEATIDETTITLNKATVDGDVTGVSAFAETVNATNTQIIFEGAASKVTGTVTGDMLAGDSTTSKGASLSTENTGNSVGNLAGFDELNFDLPANIKPGTENAVITITDATKDTDLRNAIVNLTAQGDVDMDKGDKLYLLKKTGSGELKLNDEIFKEKLELADNAFEVNTAVYTKGDDANKNDLVIEIVADGDSKETLDNKKSVAETIAASLALLNSGADFMTDQALNEAKLAAKDGKKDNAMMPFVAFGGNSMKYKSGSHIDAKGWNAALGFAKEQGELLYGIAVEHGQANYDSYVSEVHGEGKNKYTGGVIFAELKKESGVHFDASFRAGKAKSDYSATLVNLGIPHDTRYDKSATYLGFSIGGGKETKLSEAGTLDLYARYYFNHLNGSDAKLADDVNVDFKDADSSRLRLGTRYTQKLNEKNRLYAGLAWQYEFAGKAKASFSVSGVDAPSPSLKGHSAMAELGWKADAGKNLTIDLGVNGWLGKQRGIAGNLGFKWTF